MARYQIIYRNTGGKGATVIDIEKINKNTELKESGKNRFDLKVQIENGIKNVINFVYTQKLYVSIQDAKELVNEFLKPY